MSADYIILAVLFSAAVIGGAYLKHESKKYRDRKNNERHGTCPDHRHAH